MSPRWLSGLRLGQTRGCRRTPNPPVSLTVCQHRGREYPEGSQWLSPSDPCQQCSCVVRSSALRSLLPTEGHIPFPVTFWGPQANWRQGQRRKWERQPRPFGAALYCFVKLKHRLIIRERKPQSGLRKRICQIIMMIIIMIIILNLYTVIRQVTGASGCVISGYFRVSGVAHAQKH